MACQCTNDRSCNQCVKDLARVILENNKALQKVIAWEGYDDERLPEEGTDSQ